MEGRHCFEPTSGCLTAGRTLPVLEYCNTNCGSGACTPAACGAFQTERGQAVIGGFVYRGCTLPDLHGEYFYSDTYNDWIHTFKGVSGGDAQNVLDRSAQLGSHSVTSFGEDARGELYFTDYGAGRGLQDRSELTLVRLRGGDLARHRRAAEPSLDGRHQRVAEARQQRAERLLEGGDRDLGRTVPNGAQDGIRHLLGRAGAHAARQRHLGVGEHAGVANEARVDRGDAHARAVQVFPQAQGEAPQPNLVAE
jgi:hypothetical protein